MPKKEVFKNKVVNNIVCYKQIDYKMTKMGLRSVVNLRKRKLKHRYRDIIEW